MSYTRIVPIEFNHCDPAGIVFYPRYFEMINSVVENFFEDYVGYSFARMHTGGNHHGVPTVSITCNFMAPSRLGDKVPFTLVVTGVGRSSLKVRITAAVGDEVRLTQQVVAGASPVHRFEVTGPDGAVLALASLWPRRVDVARRRFLPPETETC